MPVAPSYPGVYVEEIPSGVHTIVGVTTAVTAFIDGFQRGAMDEAVQIFSWEDFRREYGGLDESSEASYAVWQFYQNGGGEAWVVRCAPAGTPGAAATIVMQDATNNPALTLKAASPGVWGNAVVARVDPVDAATFDLTVSEIADGVTVRQEVFRGLTVATAAAKIAAGSQVVTVDSVTGVPLANGTISIAIPAATPQLPGVSGRSIKLQFGSGAVTEVKLGSDNLAQLTDVRDALQAAIRATNPTLPEWAGATVTIVGGANPQLRILAGSGGDPSALIAVTKGADNTLTDLGFKSVKVTANVQAYDSGAAAGFQSAGATGKDPGTPDVPALQGALQRLKDVSFNLLSIPITATLGESDANAVIGAATVYCENRRAFMLVDPPSAIVTVPKIKDWLDQNAGLRSRNSAVYWPALRISDPASTTGPRTVGPSGTMAGVYARTDSERGVWKSPAGIDATLRGVQQLDYVMNDAENGTLNPVAINALRVFAIYGPISWGARTTRGADALTDDYKYISPRRVALYIENSLLGALKWVVFEPNDEPLWAQIRLNVGAFMHDLFRQGAFQGKSPKEAYLVKCDGETTTQSDINLGIVNIVVGFAPLKPAEFVIIQIQQLAGQIQV